MPLIVIKSGVGSAAPGHGGGAGRAHSGSHPKSAAPKPAGYFPAWQLAADTIKSSAAAAPGVGQPVAPTTVATTPATTATTSAPRTIYVTPTTRAAVVQTTTPATSPAPAPVQASAPAPPAHSITGVVTYYDATPGTCASPSLPFGTVVTITNPDNGATVRCTVDDREADTARQIDLATATFAQLAPLSQGVISNAELSW